VEKHVESEDDKHEAQKNAADERKNLHSKRAPIL
jgi:hypothetical protein